MTLKTDLKFALIVLAILGAVFFSVWRTLHSGPLNANRVKSSLRLNMSRAELSQKLGRKIDVMWGGTGWQLSALFVLREPQGRSHFYHFIFDRDEHLKEAYEEEETSQGYRQRPIALN